MEQEFRGTLNWFASTASQVSAHIVIAGDGTIARVVQDHLQAWHDSQNNAYYLGVELVQPRIDDPITEPQLRSLAWWLREIAAKYGFAFSASTLPFHSETIPGQAIGKSDPFLRGDPAGYVFRDKLFGLLR